MPASDLTLRDGDGIARSLITAMSNLQEQKVSVPRASVTAPANEENNMKLLVMFITAFGVLAVAPFVASAQPSQRLPKVEPGGSYRPRR